jgi:homoserine kinase
VVSWTETDPVEGASVDQPTRVYRAVRLDPHPSLRPVVLIPQERSSTAHTRGLLPEMVPHGDAAFNLSRAALAVVALTQRTDLLLPATADRLHQTQRAPALPLTTKWIARLREAGIAATVSGAGPTILALGTSEFPTELRELAAADGLELVEPGLADGVLVH